MGRFSGWAWSGSRIVSGDGREALERMDRVQALEAERLRLDEELERQERERDALRMPLRGILRQLGRLPDASANNAAEEPDWPGCLEALLREWESARAENAEVVRLRARSEEQAVEVREAEAVHHDAVREVERLLNMAQVPDAEAFYRRHGAKLEREALERRREDLEDALRLAARDLYGADADIPAFFASFGEADKEVLEAELASLAGRLSMLVDEEERLADSLRTQEVRLEQAEGSETLSRLRLRAASLSGTIRGLGLEWSRYALARHLLLEARGRFEKERQPGVVRAASALFSAITGGAWVGIAASLEDSSLRVLPPHGEPVSPEVLSGARRNSSIWPCGSRISAITRRRPPHCRSSWTTYWSTLIPIAPCVRLKPSAIWLLRKKVRRGISFCTSLATRIWRTCSARPSPASGCMSWRGERSGKRNDGQWEIRSGGGFTRSVGYFLFLWAVP